MMQINEIQKDGESVCGANPHQQHHYESIYPKSSLKSDTFAREGSSKLTNILKRTQPYKLPNTQQTIKKPPFQTRPSIHG